VSFISYTAFLLAFRLKRSFHYISWLLVSLLREDRAEEKGERFVMRKGRRGGQ